MDGGIGLDFGHRRAKTLALCPFRPAEAVMLFANPCNSPASKS